MEPDRLWVVFFCPQRTRFYEDPLLTLGREVVTCGLLFHRKPTPEGKLNAELFLSETNANSFVRHDNFAVREDRPLTLDSYKIDTSAVYSVMVTDARDEVDMIYKLCAGCCEVKKPFNISDRFSTFAMPFYQPRDDKDLYSVKEMHSAQAVVLILRAGLSGSSSPVRERVSGLNSRVMTPQSLRDVLVGMPGSYQMEKAVVKVEKAAVTSSNVSKKKQASCPVDAPSAQGSKRGC